MTRGDLINIGAAMHLTAPHVVVTQGLIGPEYEELCIKWATDLIKVLGDHCIYLNKARNDPSGRW